MADEKLSMNVHPPEGADLPESVDLFRALPESYTRLASFKRRSVKKRPFWHGFWRGLTSVGRLYPGKFKPVHYPSSYKDDLFAIGEDMWKAFERERNDRPDRSQTA